MTISEERYRDCVQVTYPGPDDRQAMLVVSITGLKREREALTMLLLCDETPDRVQVCQQLGELFWHYRLLLTALDLSLQEVMDENIRALCARFPDNQAIQVLARRYLGTPGMEASEEPHTLPVPPNGTKRRQGSDGRRSHKEQ